jgi:hypothetical protein
LLGTDNCRSRFNRLSIDYLTMAALGFLFASNALYGQIVQGAPVVADNNASGGQSASTVYLDTTKLPGSTVDARIDSCIANNNAKCDASNDSGTIANTITISKSGVSLILGNLTAPSGTSTPLLSITGSNNSISCQQGWNSTLDASLYTGTTGVIHITGSGNHISGCYVIGSYLSNTNTTPTLQGDCITIVSSNDNEIDGNYLLYCGANGVNVTNANRARIRDNYILRSYAAGVNANATTGTATSPGSFGGDVFDNWIQDTQLQWNSSNAGAGTGNINISATSMQGALQGWLIHFQVGPHLGIFLIAQPEVVIHQLAAMDFGNLRHFLGHRRCRQRRRIICRQNDDGSQQCQTKSETLDLKLVHGSTPKYEVGLAGSV